MGDLEGAKWAATGRHNLQERVVALVASDGSFSQYSVVYQRVLIDTLIIAERWRRALDLPKFSIELYERAATATLWLFSLTSPENGDAPNLGANDGAALLPLNELRFRDFRPSVQMAAALFCNSRAYHEKLDADGAAAVLGVSIPHGSLPVSGSVVFPDGGIAALHAGTSRGYLRFPNFRFRPSQADLLHFDLWNGSEALLRDAGSFSYAADVTTYEYFSGTRSHNTVMFDNRDQMERLGRFLFADWINSYETPIIEEFDNSVSIAASYRTRTGTAHRRTVFLSPNRAEITDEISGFENLAVLRWRLPRKPMTMSKNQVQADNFTLKFGASVAIERAEIVSGLESIYYLAKSECDVLEIEVHLPGSLTTIVEW